VRFAPLAMDCSNPTFVIDYSIRGQRLDCSADPAPNGGLRTSGITMPHWGLAHLQASHSRHQGIPEKEIYWNERSSWAFLCPSVSEPWLYFLFFLLHQNRIKSLSERLLSGAEPEYQYVRKRPDPHSKGLIR